MKAQVRIVLDIGDDSNTWVTYVPIKPAYPRSLGVVLAIGEASALFTSSILRDVEILAERLADEERA